MAARVAFSLLVAVVTVVSAVQSGVPAAALIMPLATCPLGYTGTNCDVTICQSLAPCLNNGTCYFNADGSAPLYLCVCQPGYTGSNCETLVDNCALAPRACENGGVCINSVNDFSCRCAAGYTGYRCQTNIDNCASSPCGANGCCTDGINTYTCTCNPGYSGTNCQTSTLPCASSPCQNGGTCSNTAGGYTCSCRSGYVGVNCQQVTSSGNKRCFLASGSPGFACLCLPGFYGTDCTQGSAAPQYTRDSCTYAVVGTPAAARLNWADANTACSLIGSSLTSVSSIEESAFLKTLIFANMPYWLGLRLDVTPIRWIDGTPIALLQWAASEPRIAACVTGTAVPAGLTWKTEACATASSYICKRCAATTTTRTTTQTTTRTTTRTTFRSTMHRRNVSYRDIMLSAGVCFPSATPTNLDVVAINVLSGQVISNFSVQLTTTSFANPPSVLSPCDAATCNVPACARFFDPTLGCRVCVCNPGVLSLTRVRDASGFASFALPPLDMVSLQATATGFISASASKLALTRRVDAGHVIPLYPSSLITTTSSSFTVLVTLTWLDDGLASHRDFDSYLRTSFRLPTPVVPSHLCTVYPGSDCNQGTNTASFITNNARVGLYPAPYSGVETIRISATTGLFQHIVYGHASDSNFAGSNARVEVLVFNTAGTLINAKALSVDVDGVTCLSCSRRRFWNTFLIDLRTATPSITTVNSLDCVPTSPVTYAAVGVFPNFPNENGPRTCC